MRPDILFALSELSHSIAAIQFAAIALWQARAPTGAMQRRALAVASGATSVWATSVALFGSWEQAPLILESIRNLAWLGFMLLLLQRGRDEGRETVRTITALYVVLGVVLACQIVVELVPHHLVRSAHGAEGLFYARTLLRMTAAVGALVLIHNLYTAAAPEARWGIKLPMIVLTAISIYDLNLYTVAYLGQRPTEELLAVRGVLMVILAPVLALGSRRNVHWKMRLSRAATFQSLSLIAICLYLAGMVVLARTLDLVGRGYIQLAQITLLVGMTLVALILIPSKRLQGWLKVTLVKHLFQHRYDYRAEWMRFTDTLGQTNDEVTTLDARAVKAIADIPEAKGGLLLIPDGNGGMTPGAGWSWHGIETPARGLSADLARNLQSTGHILEFDTIRQGQDPKIGADQIPDWVLEDPRIWVGVPLVHFDRLAGVVLLERPSINRRLDWEDFDLLRVAGRQVASYLAEARSQEALSDAKRFDEFNRRFAFIMHDIKNLVSQLNLVARNAERHADNPAFRADMVATLKGSVGKLNDMLAKLSQHGPIRGEEPRLVSLREIVALVAKAKRVRHPILVQDRGDICALADPQRLEQALGHLVQNAIDASPPAVPVELGVESHGREAALVILDKGRGMSTEFVRDRLFRPFASTKEDGFGIGAHEARALIAAMRGRIEVESTQGVGTRFTIFLPLAANETVAAHRIAS